MELQASQQLVHSLQGQVKALKHALASNHEPVKINSESFIGKKSDLKKLEKSLKR